jgi:hypothetical protein
MIQHGSVPTMRPSELYLLACSRAVVTGMLKPRQTFGPHCAEATEREQVIIHLHHIDTSFIDQYGCGLLVTGRTPTVTPLSYVPHSYSESSVSSSSGTGSSRSGYAYPMAEEFKPECFLNKYGSIRDDPTPSWVWVWQEGNLSWTSLSRCYNRHCYHNGPLRIQGDKDENGREIPVKATVPVDRGVLV